MQKGEHMKRIISICLVVVFVLGFFACSGEQAEDVLDINGAKSI